MTSRYDSLVPSEDRPKAGQLSSIGSFCRDANPSSRVPSSPLFFGGPVLALVVFEPRLHEPVELLELLFGVGFGRAVFQPTEHMIFDQAVSVKVVAA